ncbi:hypothetical protein VZT92_016531 [Zoarces viviparus]|uniref:Uncharacterized protein n=1 Tax=Zoarces viviparus TaxID=48416 RepID=A0AAW1EUA6_ZOAVI
MVVQRWVEVGPGRSLDDWRREGKHGSLDAVRSTPSICAAMKYNTPAVLLYRAPFMCLLSARPSCGKEDSATTL